MSDLHGDFFQVDSEWSHAEFTGGRKANYSQK